MKRTRASLLTLAGFSLLGFAVPNAHSASVLYEFTAGSMVPTLSGLPAGVTASNFSVGSFTTLVANSTDGNALRLLGNGEVSSNTTGGSITANQVLSFSLTIPADVTLSLTSLTVDYTMFGLLDVNKNLFGRVFSNIDGHDEVVADTIGIFPADGGGNFDAPGTHVINLANPEGNYRRGTNVNSGDFDDLTNQTITFYMPYIDFDAPNTSYVELDNVALNFTIIPEPAVALLGSFGMLVLLRRRR